MNGGKCWKPTLDSYPSIHILNLKLLNDVDLV